jgi:hypothetical protein
MNHDIWRKVLEMLGPSPLIQVSQTCKKLYRLCRDIYMKRKYRFSLQEHKIALKFNDDYVEKLLRGKFVWRNVDGYQSSGFEEKEEEKEFTLALRMSFFPVELLNRQIFPYFFVGISETGRMLCEYRKLYNNTKEYFIPLEDIMSFLDLILQENIEDQLHLICENENKKFHSYYLSDEIYMKNPFLELNYSIQETGNTFIIDKMKYFRKY